MICYASFICAFVSDASVDEMVIGSRLHVDWGNDESIAKVGVVLWMLSVCYAKYVVCVLC